MASHETPETYQSFAALSVTSPIVTHDNNESANPNLSPSSPEKTESPQRASSPSLSVLSHRAASPLFTQTASLAAPLFETASALITPVIATGSYLLSTASHLPSLLQNEASPLQSSPASQASPAVQVLNKVIISPPRRSSSLKSGRAAVESSADPIDRKASPVHSVTFAQLVKEYQLGSSQFKASQDTFRRQADQDLSKAIHMAQHEHYQIVTNILSHHQRIHKEYKQLLSHLDALEQQSQAWIKVLNPFHTALKELGDIEHWSQSMESQVKMLFMPSKEPE